MQWRGRRTSGNIEDRRGGGRGGLGIAGVIILLIGAYFGIDLSGVLRFADTVAPAQNSGAPVQQSAAEKDLRDFAAVVLAETEDTWQTYFRARGQSYRAPTMVLYRGATRTACGTGQSVMGPFYCPADEKIYLDLSFYDDMRRKLRANGDFAFAYVIAHEVGHHIQNLAGISRQTQAMQQRSTQTQANRISVMVELQADCFAGVWAHDVRNKSLLDTGDVEEAFTAAQAVGDDRLQQQSSGQVIPDSFTHGSSAQRLAWFRRGLESGNPDSCNTFGG